MKNNLKSLTSIVKYNNMTFLITNDDGVNSSGLLALYEAVSDLSDTTVVAPLTQQSGVGHKITLMKPLRATESQLKDETLAYAVDGTPTDCVILATKSLMDKKPDLVLSGINIGENLSKSITTSGTLGATFESALFKIPSIAVSLQVIREDLKFKNGVYEIDFTDAKRILRNLVINVIEKGMPENVDILNLNIPAKPKNDKITQTHFAHRMYTTDVKKDVDPYGRPYYWIIGNMTDDNLEGSDVHVLREQSIPTVTPISLDMGADIDLTSWLD